MSAMETMAKNLLKALGIDPEALQLEFTTRVEQFEKNIDRLNEHLLQINLRLTDIQARLTHLENHLGVPPYEPFGHGKTNLPGSESEQSRIENNSAGNVVT